MIMKKPLKKHTQHQLWAWVSLTINISIATIAYAGQAEMKILLFGIALAFLSLLQGLMIVWRDRDKGSTVVLDYICVLVLSLLLMYKVCDEGALLAFWCMAPALLLEGVVVFYRTEAIKQYGFLRSSKPVVWNFVFFFGGVLRMILQNLWIFYKRTPEKGVDNAPSLCYTIQAIKVAPYIAE